MNESPNNLFKHLCNLQVQCVTCEILLTYYYYYYFFFFLLNRPLVQINLLFTMSIKYLIKSPSMQFLLKVFYCRPVSLTGQHRSHDHFPVLSLVKSIRGPKKWPHTIIFTWMHKMLTPGQSLRTPLKCLCFSTQGVQIQCIHKTICVWINSKLTPQCTLN